MSIMAAEAVISHPPARPHEVVTRAAGGSYIGERGMS